MRRQKIYKFVCDVSNRERIFLFVYYQPAYDVRSAFRLMKEQLRNYYGWKFIYMHYWFRLDIPDFVHYKIY